VSTGAERERLFERFISARGLKSTRQRALIVDTFFGLEGHLSVEQLWEEVHRLDSRVSVATVYRTMKLLAESGLASAQNFGDGHTRYEAAEGRVHHDHLICTSCEQIVEFENDQIERLQEAVAKKHGFKVTSHKMELHGLCRACQRTAGGSRA
jgi:Fur family transcriptional regulator, ferric uptake regulator